MVGNPVVMVRQRNMLKHVAWIHAIKQLLQDEDATTHWDNINSGEGGGDEGDHLT